MHSEEFDNELITDQLINEMFSFLNETESIEKRQCRDSKSNPLCSAINSIVDTSSVAEERDLDIWNNPNAKNQENKVHNYIEQNWRDKDPYVKEVNRVIYTTFMGHPPDNSPEYFQAAEEYAIYGKDFLDFPTNMNFFQLLSDNCLKEVAAVSPAFLKHQLHPTFGPAINKLQNQPFSTNVQQQQKIFVNHTNYCNFPMVQSPSLFPPLLYSNPFLMTQYLNMFVKETQINTSMVQQHQFLAGGIQERLVYAQMLQQQIQTNHTAAFMSSCLKKNTSNASCKNEMSKSITIPGVDVSNNIKSTLETANENDNSEVIL